MVNMVKQALAVFLVLTAIAVAINLILTPVYHDGSDDYAVWKVMNWFMAAAALVVLVVGFQRRRSSMSEEAGTLEYLRTSGAYYGAIVLAMLFFWEWFWTLNPDSETGEAVTSHMVYFPLVDSLLVVLALSSGRHLWNEAQESEAQPG